MKVTLFDYGAGNLHSLGKALASQGADVRVETDPVACARAGALVLPGVGAFGQAAERLAKGREALKDALENGLPCLGICLGMQLFFDSSEEGEGPGLGFLPGQVRKLTSRRIPHMGWNTLEEIRDDRLLGMTTAYYAHSYICDVKDVTANVAYTTHEGVRFASAVVKHRALGVQFHPEKSSQAGLSMLRSFLDGARAASRKGA